MKEEFFEGFEKEVKKETRIKILKWAIIGIIIIAIAIFSGLKIRNYYLVKSEQQRIAKTLFKNLSTPQTKQNKYANYKDEEILRVDYPKDNELSYYPTTYVTGAVLKEFEVYINGTISERKPANDWYDYFSAIVPLNIGNNSIKIEAKKESKIVSRAVSVNVLDTLLAYNFDRNDYISHYNFLSGYSFAPSSLDFKFDDFNISSGTGGTDNLSYLNDWLSRTRTQIQETENQRRSDLQSTKNTYDSNVAAAKSQMESQLASLNCVPALSGSCSGQQKRIIDNYRTMTDLYKSAYDSRVKIINEFADSKIKLLRETEQNILNKISELGG
jgi:hypothetical protein